MFAPREDLEDVPFDLILHSRVYRFAYALAYRMGVLFRRRSNLYPENVRQFPWNDALIAAAPQIEALRDPLLRAYHLLHDRERELDDAVAKLGLARVRDVIRIRRDVSLDWAAVSADSGRAIPITRGTNVATGLADGGRRVSFGNDFFDYVIVQGDEAVAEWLADAFRVNEGRRLTRDQMLDMAMPASEDEAVKLREVLGEFSLRDAVAERDAVLSALDALVGGALGLSEEDVSEIQRDLREDVFLRTLGVREPFTSTRLVGIRQSLTRSDRYE